MTPVITAWSAVSPFGPGRPAFVDGVRSGRSTAAPVDPVAWQVPDREACLVPDYDPAALVGGRVARTADRVTVLALAAVGHLVDHDTDPGDRTGLVFGTTAGSVQSTMNITRDSLVNRKPYFVDPKTLPNGVMNCAAAQCAIRYGLTGPNTTIAGGPGAGLFALAYANRLLAAGRADRVFVGAMEEYSVGRAWLAHHNRDGGPPLGEGGVVFRVEPDSRAPLAEILAEIVAVDSKVGCRDAPDEHAVRSCVNALLAKGSARAEDVWAAISATGTLPEHVVATELFGADTLGRCPGIGQIGDQGAASAAFAIASALSVHGADDQLVVITSSEPSGSTTGVLLRLKGGEDR